MHGAPSTDRLNRNNSCTWVWKENGFYPPGCSPPRGLVKTFSTKPHTVKHFNSLFNWCVALESAVISTCTFLYGDRTRKGGGYICQSVAALAVLHSRSSSGRSVQVIKHGWWRIYSMWVLHIDATIAARRLATDHADSHPYSRRVYRIASRAH